MPGGGLTSSDNHRLLAAKLTGYDLPIYVRNSGDLPMAAEVKHSPQNTPPPKTMGGMRCRSAVANQAAAWHSEYPYGNTMIARNGISS